MSLRAGWSTGRWIVDALFGEYSVPISNLRTWKVNIVRSKVSFTRLDGIMISDAHGRHSRYPIGKAVAIAAVYYN